MRWHVDRTFKKVPSLGSILTVRKVPTEGGATEFVSTRSFYESLNEATKASLAKAVVEHDFAWSRGPKSVSSFLLCSALRARQLVIQLSRSIQ